MWQNSTELYMAIQLSEGSFDGVFFLNKALFSWDFLLEEVAGSLKQK